MLFRSTRSGVKGFLAKLLFEKAQECWNSLDLQAFEEIVALLIYGLVLFPNPDQLVDVNAVKIFLSRNPIPTVIGGNRTDCLKCWFAKCRGKQESPPSFIFSKWKGQKHRKIPYRDCSRFGR